MTDRAEGRKDSVPLARTHRQRPRQRWLRSSLALSLCVLTACQQSPKTRPPEGITRNRIYLGSVLALQGQEEALGSHMKAGLEAAFEGERVKQRQVRLDFENDFYEPPTAKLATQKLIDRGVFLTIGNVGTPTAEVTLPLLADAGVPAVGFFTGAGLLRQNNDRPIVNYRSSYAQELEVTIDIALNAGLTPEDICVYVQNDSYGMAGLAGLKAALDRAGASPELLETYDRVLNTTGDPPPRNNLGPVGVYQRNTPEVAPGYNSLKAWEQETGQLCQFVVTGGSYSNVARFVQHARERGETWVVSALSFTGGDDYRFDLEEYGVTDGIVMTQVVPLLNSDLPIVREARNALGDEFGYVSLEGYIVGKMTLKILNDVPGQLTRDSFMKQVAQSRFDLGGIEIDFTDNDNQGSDLVIVSYLTPDGFRELETTALKAMLGQD
ncbi:ABC transporter substrate-binding protein [Baaleninema simplex]|uniref:ABC transporter substrate-binding protein n=1 Tax=Baaleninema simplex TaxID=2862350 RepID=UPI0003465A82|nr:ABC transporter substrate-binding protein [Baaleninema simplex]